jgi:CRP/FNR family transcriptional regulator, cyclic AMP receptor protein
MLRPTHALDDLALEGLNRGFLFALPHAAAERLLAEAIRINVPAGSLIYRDDQSPSLIVVIKGLLRVFLTSADGRQLTVRYARSGDVAGLALVIGGPAPMSIQAMTSSLVLALRVDSLRVLLATDPGVASACAEELTRQIYRLLDDISEQAFLSLRQRLARQLLLLATSGPGRDLVVHIGQQELADAIGSVREVVTRNLHELHEEGLLDISRDEVTIRDPIALADVAGERLLAAPGASVPRRDGGQASRASDRRP